MRELGFLAMLLVRLCRDNRRPSKPVLQDNSRYSSWTVCTELLQVSYSRSILHVKHGVCQIDKLLDTTQNALLCMVGAMKCTEHSEAGKGEAAGCVCVYQVRTS